MDNLNFLPFRLKYIRLVYGRRVYPKVSGPAAWSENCKWYNSLALGGLNAIL
jgi:hypothetical protein